MTSTEIVEWIQNEFKPVTLATPQDTIFQMVENARRYWNTNSGYKLIKVYPVANNGFVQLDPEFKVVVKVYPTTQTESVWESNPVWTLLGVQVFDNMTSDLILMSEALKAYRVFAGATFYWRFIKSEDPDIGGKLFVRNLPTGVAEVAVEGTKRVLFDEDILSEYVLDWILNYSKCLLKMAEGNALRKSDIIGVKNDGQQLFDEGKDDRESLEKKLAVSGRWVALAQKVGS